VIFLRFIGLFEAPELWLFDRMMMLKPSEAQDERLLIIQVTKEDIETDTQKYKEESRQKGASLSDRTLLDILKKLTKNKNNKPKAIGLDIYRDFETKNNELLRILTDKNNSIFGVCFVGNDNDKGVAPPPEFIHERLGFSDFLTVKESIIRRQLLLMPTKNESPCVTTKNNEKQPVQESFPLVLSKRYFKDKKYQEPFKPGNPDLQIGDTIFESLYSDYRGGYSMWIDVDEGDQILLNYRTVCLNNSCSPKNLAKTVTVADVLKNDFLQNNNQLNKQIVLIGITDSTFPDGWYTPFSSGGDGQIPGVIIQAQMLSQILSAVEDKRPLLTVWSIWQDMVWIFAWSLLGGILAQIFHTKKLILFGTIVTFFIIYYLLFIFLMIWVPFLPPVLSFLITLKLHNLKSQKI
jgi:CHASE2 domain-containing sensor protein